MEGFEIKINEETAVHISSDAVISVTLYTDNITNNSDICASGNSTKCHRSIWIQRKLDLGDRVKIKITEIDKITPPLKSYQGDRSELVKLYLQLKKELEEKGMI